MYKVVYNDELYHHGVKGMKWGVRKDRYTRKRDKILSKINRVSSKGNRNLRAAARIRKDATDLKKAGFTDEGTAVMKVSNDQYKKGVAKRNKRVEKLKGKLNKLEQKHIKKLTKARDRRAKFAQSRVKASTRSANYINGDIKSIKKYGLDSEAWKNRVSDEYTVGIKTDSLGTVKFTGSNLNDIAIASSVLYDKKAMNTYLKDLQKDYQDSMNKVKRWSDANNKLMATKINATSSKKDLDDIIRKAMSTPRKKK